MVLAGGGFRFGYYLGMHAAAVDAGRPPDLLLATCGGAIAGAIIAGLPDTASRKAWLMSPRMHTFFSGLRSGPRASPLRALTQVALRRVQRAAASRIPDLYRDYLFEMPANLPLPAPAPVPVPAQPSPHAAATASQAPSASEVASAHHACGAPALAILGGRLLFGADEAGQARGDRTLYQITLFANERAAALVDGLPAAMRNWTDTVAPTLHADTTMAVADAARISITDMFYFKAQQANNAHYTGGAVDLMPIELAHLLAHQVTMEIKQPYDRLLAIPALRAVFGIDGNQRMRHVQAQQAATWIDTSDASTTLRGTGIQKRIDWRRNRIQLVAPGSYDQYAADIETQWRYGYERAQKAYQA